MDIMDLSNSTNALRISSSEFPSIFDDSSMIVDSNYEWRNSSNNIVTAADMMDFAEAPQSSQPNQTFGAGAPMASTPAVSLVSASVEKTLMTPNPLLHSLPKVEIRSGHGFGAESGLRRSKRSAAIAASNILIPAAAAALQPNPDQKTTRRYTRRASSGKSTFFDSKLFSKSGKFHFHDLDFFSLGFSRFPHALTHHILLKILSKVNK
jgi:hypothetical protein